MACSATRHFVIRHSSFVIRYSPFTIHYSLFTIHYSLRPLTRTRRLLRGSLYGHDAPVIERLSMRHPGADTGTSDKKRHRSVMVCPFRFGPRSITVSM